MLNSAPNFKVTAAYDAAADHFDCPELDFWNRHGRKAVQLAALRTGDRVLDVGCGTGASALPAARAVGANGQVTGLDLSEKMLGVARAKANRNNVRNVDFKVGDMRCSGHPDNTFDAVISVFSLFFVTDMEAQVAELWRMLKPGGRLVVSVWDRDGFEPLNTIFSAALQQHAVPVSTRPWKRFTDPEYFTQTLIAGGAATPALHMAPDMQPLGSAEAMWTVVLGSGYRGEIEDLPAAMRQELRTMLAAEFRDRQINHIGTGAIHAVSVKPA